MNPNEEEKNEGIIITALKEILPEAVAALMAHGCYVTFHSAYCKILFPSGTTREETLPRMQHCVRYEMVLPDGFLVMEVWIRHLKASVLYYSRRM